MTAHAPCKVSWLDVVWHYCHRSTATPHTNHICPCGANVEREDGPTSIRDHRIAVDVTKSQAAQYAGWSRRTWHDVEEGADTDHRMVAKAHETLDAIAANRAAGRDWDGG